VRVLFAAEQNMEAAIRRRIVSALSTGHLPGPDGVINRWQLTCSQHSHVRAEEMDLAERLIRT
jgi:hypothetical protein